MDIGVVCEGATDYITIKYFLEKDFLNMNCQVSFHLIQPSLDETLPGGWTQVINWLQNNTYFHRRATYIKGGAIFEHESRKKYDALIFQIDSDIIGNESFNKFLSGKGFGVSNPVSSIDRASYIRSVILFFSKSPSNDKTEILLPIVESCESWIIAADNGVGDEDNLKNIQIHPGFERVYHKYIKSPRKWHKCSEIDKNKKERENLCGEMVKAGKTPIGLLIVYDDLIYSISDKLDINISSEITTKDEVADLCEE